MFHVAISAMEATHAPVNQDPLESGTHEISSLLAN